MVGKNNRHFNLSFGKKLTVKQKAALILGLSLCITVLAGLSAKMKDSRVTSISRPDASTVKEVELDAYEAGSEEPVRLNLKINPKSYSSEEATRILDETVERLEEIIRGDNESLSDVRHKLSLPASLTEYGITAEWFSSDFQTLGYDGAVYNSELAENEKKEVDLLVRLRLGDQEREKTLHVTVAAPLLSAEEKDKAKLIDALNSAQGEAAESDSFSLPEKVDGKDVVFSLPENSGTPLIFLFLGIMGAAAVVIGERKKREKQQKERSEALLKDYATITSKLSLFFGAGMTVYGACEKIIKGYLAEKEKRPGVNKPAYECLNDSMNLIENGASEPEGYTGFGDKCGIREYKKLGAYLSDHVRKGTGDLGRLLREETRESFLTRKALVKSKAQEAGTRMLFPMVLMLGVVMAIVLIPSMMSFTI